MVVFRRHRLSTAMAQLQLRGRNALESVVVKRDSGSASTASQRVPFKLSIPAIVGIAIVGIIITGLIVLLWRWRVRVREIARMNRQFRASYEKYGIGRGIESSNSSGSKKSKSDPYGSFFEVETEKPKKALLTFRRSSSSNGHGSLPATATAKQNFKGSLNSQGYNGGGGWGGSSSSGHGHKVAPSREGYYTQRPSPAAHPAAPPGLNGRRSSSRRSSFSFSLRKSEERRVQHLPTSTIKSKGISAPLIVANGGAEPWSPLPLDASATNANNASLSSTIPPLAVSAQQPAPPPPVAFPQKFKQPQPRSLPDTPGTSQKRDTLLTVVSNVNAPSDGSLYSRNSFCSSDPHLLLSAQQAVSASGVANTQPTTPSSSKTMSPKNYTPYPSSSYTYAVPSGDGEVVRPGSANSYHPESKDNLPRLMTVVAPFMPTLEDELPLKVGDTVRVIEEYRDGWCLVQQVGRIDSPRGVVPCVCLQERKRIVPVPVNVGGPSHQNTAGQWR
ncbi:hypothetical protein D9611_013370 [Ephemerocybe angulata]|uniref:SH3 domain-containing protein n=1 Tax=Ephemerocybe angulata TaxID=980116 RepID=A0A8H5CBG0_9AGAR|nr:hypothetical protein D9611_013370 [Tulosesus angulatus]